MTTTYVDVTASHSSIFAVQTKPVPETLLNPIPISNSPGIIVPCDHCGTILTPIWFNIVIFLLAGILAIYGVVKDHVDARKAGESDFSVLRKTGTQEQIHEELKRRAMRKNPWYHNFWEGHLFFGAFWYYRADLSRWARFLIIGTSLIAEECILGVLYWKIKDKPDDACDRAIYEIYHSLGPTDAFLVFITIIMWTPFTILLMMLFHHLKVFAGGSMYACRVVLSFVLIFIFVGLGTAGVVELSVEMCASTSVSWVFTFIYLMIGEVMVTHTFIALIRAFLMQCSQTAWRDPVT
jgi:hypothetical protein